MDLQVLRDPSSASACSSVSSEVELSVTSAGGDCADGGGGGGIVVAWPVKVKAKGIRDGLKKNPEMNSKKDHHHDLGSVYNS